MATPELEQVERALRRVFPRLAVRPLRHLDTGFGSLVFETADGVVFRVARSSAVAQGHAVEWRVLPRLAQRLPAPVPLPQWRIEPNDPDLPFGAIGYRKLPGHALEPPAARPWLAVELAAFFKALHAIPAAYLEVPEAPPIHRQIALTRAAVLSPLRRALEAAELDELEHALDQLAADEMLDAFDPVIRHGDPWWGNILVDRSAHLAGVVDWEGLELGDPAWEAAAQVYLGEAFVEEFHVAYGADDAFRYRARRLAWLRELGGVRRAVETGDQDELEDAVRKLRASPILAAASSPRRR